MTPRPPPRLGLLVGLLVGLLPLGHVRAEGIQVRCEPEHLLLGGTASAEIHLVLPPEATGVELLASQGEVGPLTQVRPGRYRATYQPPRRNLPLEVVLVALARGPRGPLEGWTVLPLWGQGQADVHTRPGTPVTLRVGEASFGPVVADATGLAQVTLSVPPGTSEAFFGNRRIELGVPPWPRVHAVPARSRLQADREEVVDVRLYASRLGGEAPAPRAFSFSVPRGQVSAPLEREPGVFLARWTVPPGPAGALVLQGSVLKRRESAFEARVMAEPGPAQRFALKVDREELLASEQTHVGVEISAWDAVGNPTSAGLRLESDLALEGALTERRPGEYAGVMQVPPRFGGRERLELRLLREGSATPVGAHTVRLRAGPLARVRVEPERPVVVADGRREAAWRISVEDRFGNAVDEPLTEVSPSGGALEARAPGQYALRYVPPEARADGRAEVEVRVGEVRGTGVQSQLRPSVVSLAARLGAVTNFADVRAPSLGLRLEVWPLRTLPALGVWLDAGYLRFSRAGSAVVPDFQGLNQLWDGTLGVGVRSPREYPVQGWAGAGLALARVQGRVTWNGGRVVDEGAWVPGAQAVAGAGVRWGPGGPFLEARVCWFDDPSLGVLRGSLRGSGLHVGYRLELF